MKKILAIALILLLTLGLAAPVMAATSDENKETLIKLIDCNETSAYKRIINQAVKIIRNDAITISDEQLSELTNLVVSGDALALTFKGYSADDYTAEEQQTALGVADQVCKILDVSYTIDPTNDPQGDSSIVVSIYKNGILLGKIDSDAKTDLVDGANVWYLIGGAVLLLAALAMVFVLIKKRRTQTETETA